MEHVARAVSWVLVVVFVLLTFAAMLGGVAVSMPGVMNFVVFVLALWGLDKGAERAVVRGAFLLNASWGLLTAALGVVAQMQGTADQPIAAAALTVSLTMACLVNSIVLWRRLRTAPRFPRTFR